MALSVFSLTHWLPHAAYPVPQRHAPHAQPVPQVCVPLVHPCVVPGAHMPAPVQADQADQVPPTHVRVSVPQFPQACVPGPLQIQTSFWQVDPLGQAFPQAPQLALSLCSFTHTPLQGCVPAGHPHLPPWHIIPPAQTFPHVPQFSLLEFKFTHEPLQSVGAEPEQPVAHA